MTVVLANACSYPELPFGSEERPSTLAELISSVWDELATQSSEAAVTCPVCGGQMKREHIAVARSIGGRCADCRSMLS